MKAPDHAMLTRVWNGVIPRDVVLDVGQQYAFYRFDG